MSYAEITDAALLANKDAFDRAVELQSMIARDNAGVADQWRDKHDRLKAEFDRHVRECNEGHPCSYEVEYIDVEEGEVEVCVTHGQNSKWTYLERGHDRPCLTIDPYVKEA